MKVLIAHNEYRLPGGEEAVATEEASLLRATGVEVRELRTRSTDLDGMGLVRRLRLGISLRDHDHGRSLVREGIRDRGEPVDVVHFHNLYPLLGPGAVREARALGCGVVQTLHNFRLSCLRGTHLIDGEICERCRPGRFGPGITRACYRGSRLQSAAMARGLTRQWDDLCAGEAHRVLTLTGFMRDRYLGFGLPPERVVVKPNSAPATHSATDAARRGVVFAGRLSEEKGIAGLVDAWPTDAPRLTVVGDGPLEGVLRQSGGTNVEVLGRQARDRVLGLLASAKVLVVPSVWFEGGLPLVALEALSVGTPVVAFDLGAMTSLANVDDRLLTQLGDFESLVESARAIHGLSDAESETLSRRCREFYERDYTPESNVERLLDVYRDAIDRAREPADTVTVVGIPLVPHSRSSMVEEIVGWAADGRSGYVCAVNVHSTMEARGDERVAHAMNAADLNIPDGTPVAWGMSLLGAHGHERVHGATLMWDVCAAAEREGLPIALYGSTEEVLAALSENLLRAFPSLDIRAAISPPFRDLVQHEEVEMVTRLNGSGARIVFVGLGAPKQELWMHAHEGSVRAVMLGVGAAFDIHAGRQSRAPQWMQRVGLEWVHRLLQEPRRLWRRYAVHNPRFLAALAGQVVRDRFGR